MNVMKDYSSTAGFAGRCIAAIPRGGAWLLTGVIILGMLLVSGAAYSQPLEGIEIRNGGREMTAEQKARIEAMRARATASRGERPSPPSAPSSPSGESGPDAKSAPKPGEEPAKAGDKSKMSANGKLLAVLPNNGNGATPTAAGAPADPLIDFNLKDANIDQVMQFVADNSHKPVVKSKSVTVNITIRAPEKVTPQAALDLIYDALRLEGFAVIESEDRIQIIPVAEAVQQDIVTVSGEMPPEIAKQRSRVIRRVLPLKSAKASSLEPHLKPLLGKYASVMVDDRTNKLIIIDTVRNIERYEFLIREIDTPGFDEQTVKIVQVKHGDASEIAGMMKAFADGKSYSSSYNPSGGSSSRSQPQPPHQPQPQPGAKGAPAPPPVPTVIIPDRRTNSIIIAAPQEKMEGLLDLLEKLDAEKPREINIHTIELKYADAEAVNDSIEDMLRQLSSTKGRSLKDYIDIDVIMPDNVLLVLCSDENLKLITDICDKLDRPEAQKSETKQYQLTYLDASDTASELEDLYGSLTQDNYYDPWGYGGYGRSRNRRQSKNVSFVAVDSTNSIMVMGPPSEFKLIEDLIKQLDKPINKDDVLPKVYYIKNANAKDVELVLNVVFGGAKQDSRSRNPYMSNRYGSQSQEAKVGRLFGKVSFTADENTNSIIAITNNKYNYEVVDEMIEQLDRANAELANTNIYPLQYADATELADTLNTLFSVAVQRQDPNKKPDEQAVEEAISRYVFNWGQTKQDQERPISNLIGRVRVVPDTRTNSLLVTTSANNFNVVAAFIKDLDKEEPQVLVKVRILEIRRDEDEQIGIRWTPDPSLFNREELDNAMLAISSADIIDSWGPKIPLAPSGGRTLDPGKGIITGDVNMSLMLQLLLRNLDATVLIDPELYMSNNQTGHVFVGQNVPRLGGTSSDQGVITENIENEDIGIDLVIKPNISQAGKVVMKIELQTTQISGEFRFGSDVVQKRDYETKIALNDGETIVLGGIVMDNSRTDERRLPFLGRLPKIGHWFRTSRAKASDRTELRVFITAQIIETSEEAAEIYRDRKAVIEKLAPELIDIDNGAGAE